MHFAGADDRLPAMRLPIAVYLAAKTPTDTLPDYGRGLTVERNPFVYDGPMSWTKLADVPGEAKPAQQPGGDLIIQLICRCSFRSTAHIWLCLGGRMRCILAAMIGISSHSWASEKLAIDVNSKKL